MSTIIRVELDLLLGTRRNSPIENHMSRAKSHDGAKIQIEELKKKYPNAHHRPVGPCSTFNCHGLTFAARRTWIAKPSEVQKILIEDDYVQVTYAEVMPGDIAVYRASDGSIDHSGIVVERQRGSQPRILSKWAICHEVVHLPNECPYNEMTVSYYRIADNDA